MMDSAIIRVLHPAWVSDPEAWVWSNNGERQGIGMNWRANPGLFNLLWLSMDMDRAPLYYNMKDNPLMLQVMLGAGQTTLNDVPMIQTAELRTLRQWMHLLETGKLKGALEAHKPLFQVLGKQRLYSAHT